MMTHTEIGEQIIELALLRGDFLRCEYLVIHIGS